MLVASAGVLTPEPKPEVVPAVDATPKPEVDARFEGLLLDFLAYLEFERGLSRNTLTAYRTDLLQYGAFLAARGTGPIEAEGADVADFLAGLAAGGEREAAVQPRDAQSQDRLPALLLPPPAPRRTDRRRPDRDIRPPRKGRSLPKVLSYSEVKRLLDSVAGSDPADLRDRAILEVMYGCGLRASETIGLEVGSVDLEARLPPRPRQGLEGADRAARPRGRGGGQALSALRPRA